MPLFLTQATYTPAAWATLLTTPQDRRAAISALIEKAGGRMVDLYFCFGDDDLLFIFEAPDALAAAAVAVAGNVAGHIKAIKTRQLFTVEESLTLMRTAGGLGPAPAPTAG